ncbi:MAG: type II secretion system F family protein [Gemmatimonadota bacterium]|nr:MAG: type II secretion system F family protein [Gemmatimonadota bacterium]
MSIEIALGLVFLASATIATLFLLSWNRRQRRLALVRSLKDKPLAPRPTARDHGEESFLVKLGRRTAKGARKDDDLRLKLSRAGWDSRTAPLTFAAVRLSLLVSLPSLAAVMTYAANRGRLEMAAAAAAGLLVARLIPALVVWRRTKKRQNRVRKSVPDALDLMVVCVEAGVGLDAAILRVSDELRLSHPDLAHEFRIVNQQVNVGLPRADALRDLVGRTGVDDLRSVITTLIQSEKLGVSIGRTLRVSAEALRTRRRQRAEQEARKAPIRMLIPLVLFILPALLLVLIGPAAIHIVRVLQGTGP